MAKKENARVPQCPQEKEEAIQSHCSKYFSISGKISRPSVICRLSMQVLSLPDRHRFWTEHSALNYDRRIDNRINDKCRPETGKELADILQVKHS